MLSMTSLNHAHFSVTTGELVGKRGRTENDGAEFCGHGVDVITLLHMLAPDKADERVDAHNEDSLCAVATCGVTGEKGGASGEKGGQRSAPHCQEEVPQH